MVRQARRARRTHIESGFDQSDGNLVNTAHARFSRYAQLSILVIVSMCELRMKADHGFVGRHGPAHDFPGHALRSSR